MGPFGTSGAFLENVEYFFSRERRKKTFNNRKKLQSLFQVLSADENEFQTQKTKQIREVERMT